MNFVALLNLLAWLWSTIEALQNERDAGHRRISELEDYVRQLEDQIQKAEKPDPPQDTPA